ncbi:MAG: MFS transporter [Hydrogenophaga sp.]|jgi:MFS family permease|uniref:MFS transporter n=1 Tax=Hydrogenophaga sp. TaxID=1904254 RepID=UPI002A3649CA|nr:MFS transporter [Hydrogenophaga sp.]MDX9970001.1 MFS transporter [Hydrogenophaga sp.]
MSAPPDRPSSALAATGPDSASGRAGQVTAGRDAAIVVMIGVASAMHVGKLPVAIPALQQSLGLSLVEAGFLLSMVQVAGMLIGLFIGLLADRAGPRRVMLGGLVLLALSSAAGAASTSVRALLWSRAGEGLGFLLAVLPAPALLREVVRQPKTLSRALGWWGAYMPAGAASAMLLGAWVIGWVGWRGLWVLLGLLSAVCAGVLWCCIRVGPAGHAVSGFGVRLLRTLRSPGPWLAALGFFLYSVQWLAVVGFLPTIYQDAGFSIGVVGGLSALAAGINMSGNIAAGRLLARGAVPGLVLVVGYVAMGLGAALAFGLTGQPLWQYAGVLLFSSFGGLIPGTLFGLSVSLAPSQDTVSTTVGWMQQWSSLGQFVGPPVVAALAVWAGGWHQTWIATGVCALAGVGLAVLLQRLWRRRGASA